MTTTFSHVLPLKSFIPPYVISIRDCRLTLLTLNSFVSLNPPHLFVFISHYDDYDHKLSTRHAERAYKNFKHETELRTRF